jgi:hypothetical protein
MRRQTKLSVFVVLTTLAFALPTFAGRREVRNWSHVLGLQSNVPGLRLLPFYVLSVGELDGHLSGTCVYLNEKDGQNAQRVTLEVQTDGEELWAIAALQVADNVSGPWEVIGSSGGIGQIIKLKIDPEASSPQLKVDLEAFRPLIEKRRFGRIGLKTGEGAILELSDLRRPSEGD